MIYTILAVVIIIVLGFAISKFTEHDSQNHDSHNRDFHTDNSHNRDFHTDDSHNRTPYNNGTPYIFETPEKRAGRMGERIAVNAIRRVLREDDVLLNNVPISFDGKDTELDNVIINKYGVFIIEVKSYKGRLYGREDDYEWQKYKDDGYGNTFGMPVKNPIRQVKRQIYILAKYLQYYGFDVWVEGYALLLQGNSPVDSPSVFTSLEDIDRAIHTFGRNRLPVKTVQAIKQVLESNC